MSTLSEIAANLLKLRRVAEDARVDTAAQDALAWEQLMTLPSDGEAFARSVAVGAQSLDVQRTGTVRVLRLIQGGLS